MQLHVRDTLVVLYVGNHSLPCCPKCNIFMNLRVLNGNHQDTAMCSKGAEWRLNRLREEEVQARMEVALQAYRRPLETVTAFKYLGQVLTASDGD